MERRDLLAAVAVAGGSLLAGCSGDGGDSDDDGTDVDARIRDAIRDLEANEEDLAGLEGDDPPDSFDATSIHDRADDAEAALDDAEGDASDEQQETIDVLRATASFQREAGEYGELQVEFEHCMADVEAYIDNDEWGQASENLGDCRSTLSDLDAQYDDVIAALDDVDAAHLASETAIEYDEPDEELRIAADELDALVEYVDAFERFVDGVDLWTDADAAIEREEWAAAASTFEDARTEFESSAATLRSLEDDPDTPDSLRSDVIEIRCVAEAFVDASDEMAQGCRAADDGNGSEAQDHFEAAEAALQRCE